MPRPPTSPRPRALALIMLLAGLLLGACDETETPDAGGDSSSATQTPTDAPTSEPTDPEPGTPEVAPATGPLLTQKAATVRLPKGWAPDRIVRIQSSGTGPDIATSLVAFGSLPDSTSTDTPHALAKAASISDFDRGRGRVLPEANIDGVVMGHVAGRQGGDYREEYIVLYKDQQVTIDWTFDASEFSVAYRRKIVDSMMATWQWR